MQGYVFSHGLSAPGEPTIAIRDLTGQLGAWIDVGAPELARLAGERIHRAAALHIFALDRVWLADLVSRLGRRLEFALTISEREIYLSIGDDTLPCRLENLTVP